MGVKKTCREENSALDAPVNSSCDKLWRLTEVLRVLSENKFTGYIRVNYSQGVIGRVEKYEEILKK